MLRDDYTIDSTFPSPCGEKVGINSAKKTTSRWLQMRFPSPCGEKVGINTAVFYGVPGQRVVSVPLRGKGRDQRRTSRARCTRSQSLFPSPCGEKVGINLRNRLVTNAIRDVSVPLRGKGRDQPLIPSYGRRFTWLSFRPLAGKR